MKKLHIATLELIDKPYKSRTFIHREIPGYLCDFYGFYLLYFALYENWSFQHRNTQGETPVFITTAV